METESRRGRVAETAIPNADSIMKMAGIKPPEENLTLTRVIAEPYNIIKPRKKRKVEEEELRGFVGGRPRRFLRR